MGTVESCESDTRRLCSRVTSSHEEACGRVPDTHYPVSNADLPCLLVSGQKENMTDSKTLCVESDGTNGEGKPGDKLRGLSVHFWNTLLDLLLVSDNPDFKVYDIEPRIRLLTSNHVCPRDGRRGAALVDVASDPDAGRATVMLSYSWGNRVIDIAETLLGFCQANGLDTRAVRVWVCCICVNQHRVKERASRGEDVPFEDFQAIFGEQVKSIGHVIALLSPWSSPLYTRRAWCIFELYTAATTEGVKFELVLPPCEEKAFGQTFLRDGLRSVWQALPHMKVRDAQASIESDRTRIMELVERGPGHVALDKAVAELMQTWFLSIARKQLEEILLDTEILGERGGQIAEIYSQAAEFYCELGRCDAARELCGQGLAFCCSAGAEATLGCAHLRFFHGRSFSKQGKYTSSLEHYRKSLETFEAVGGELTPGYADCLTLIGAVFREQGVFSEAMEYLRRARCIYVRSSPESPEAAICVTALGRTLEKLGKYREAEEHFKEALCIHQTANSAMQKPLAVAACIRSIGICLYKQGDYPSAIEHLGRALEAYETSGAARSSGAAHAMAWIGKAFQGQGDKQHALKYYYRALNVYVATGLAQRNEAQSARIAVEQLENSHQKARLYRRQHECLF